MKYLNDQKQIEQMMLTRIQESIDDAIYLEDHFTQDYNNEVLLLLYKIDELLQIKHDSKSII